ncbi:GMC oxidoreductase-like protein [Thozetella sp. PMI_491]|nr:GMC oxidoreductase-like protein [Thozetella sp. PMI_491]
MIFLSLLGLNAAVGAVAEAVAPVTPLRHVNQLRPDYDFVIVGGGTVLVVEYGEIQFAPGIFEPPGSPPPVDQWAFQSLPLTALGNASAAVQVGRVVGGSSAHNGQFFDRASRHDFDGWEALINPYGNNEVKWDWDSIFPFYKKSVNFVEPTEDQVAEFGYTFNTTAAYGGSGPITASFPPFQWPGLKDVFKAWVEAGISPRQQCDAGDKAGLCWITSSQDAVTAERSHAGVGHYLDVIASRTNYDLLVKHKVRRVVYDDAYLSKQKTPRVEVLSLEDGETTLVTARLEVIISAGSLHTPQILQRSGIGPGDLLREAGIDIVADLPGVGYNFQDHAGPIITANISSPVTPNSNTLSTNASYEEEAVRTYAERPAKGPYTQALSNNAVYVGLPDITPDFGLIVKEIRAQVQSGSSANNLPDGTAPAVVAGYKKQLQYLASLFEDPQFPVLESPFGGTPSGVGCLIHPLSRGTVLLNVSDPDGEPILDYRTGTNQVDVDIMVRFVPLIRKFFNASALQSWGLTETRPGPAVQTHAEIEAWIRTHGTVLASFEHPCCTAAMLPESLGGVVDEELRVHRLSGLRVVDASIFPWVPGTHLSATTYAIAERAADLIISKWEA